MKLNMRRSLVFLLILTLMSSVMPFVFATENQEKWEIKTSMKNPRAFYRVEAVDDRIYSIGGYDGHSCLSSVEVYTPSMDTWNDVAPMHDSRRDFKSAVIGEKIYVFGGLSNMSNSPRINSTEMYDPSLNIWVNKAPMAEARERFQIEVIEGKIYVLGGYSNTGALSSVEVYDPVLNAWSKKASMSVPRYNFQTEVIDGEIYAIGGYYLASAEKYDPKLDEWVALPAMSVPRTGFKTAAINRKLYSIGGIDLADHNKVLSSIEEYDPNQNKWVEKVQLPVAKQAFEVQLVNSSILTIGGIATQNSSGALSEISEFQPAVNTCFNKGSMNSTRYYFSSVKMGNKIYAIGGIDYKGNYLRSVEVYSIESSPTLTVTASPNKVKVGNRFTTTVAIHNVSNIYAEDIKIDYDAERFEYLGASAKDGLKIYKEDTSTPGSVRFIVAHLGKYSGATGDKDLIELTFKAKSVGIGKVDITKGRIADNDVLEMDVAENNCGEDTIEVESNKDVNRTGEYTLLDLGIDAYYYGMQADQTDTTRFDTDVIPDGIIDDKDLTAITQSILDNSNYPFN